MDPSSYLARTVSIMPRYTRDIANGAVDDIIEMFENSPNEWMKDDDRVRAAVSVCIWEVIIPIATDRDGDIGRSQAIRELLVMFMNGEMHAWSCSSVGHSAPLVGDHAAVSSTTMRDLVLRGVYTTDGQESVDTDWHLQRGYLLGSFLIHENTSFEEALDMFRSVDNCNFIVHHNGDFVAKLECVTKEAPSLVRECLEWGAKNMDPLEKIIELYDESWFTFQKDGHGNILHVHSGVYLEVNPFGFASGASVDFVVWEDSFPDNASAQQPQAIEARLLDAIRKSKVSMVHSVEH